MTQFKEVLYVGIDIDRVAADLEASARRGELNRLAGRRCSPRRGPSSRVRNSARHLEEGRHVSELDEPVLAGSRVA